MKIVLSIPALRIVLGATVAAHFIVWMGEVAMTWTMASLGASALWVALMQTATSMPLFILGLPSGAIADMMDKRRLLLATQVWTACIAVLLAIAVFGHFMNPALLLGLAFASGCTMALRLPLVASLVPQLVPREHLADALSFNAVSYNTARILGPVLAGLLIGLGGTGAVFAFMAALALLSTWPVLRWRWQADVPARRTPLLPAIREGVQYVWRTVPVRRLVLRVSVFFFHSCALLALLPLLVQRLADGRAAHYTLLVSCMGLGGLLGVTVVAPRLRQRVSTRALVTGSTLVLAAAMLLVAWSSALWMMAGGMLLAGITWLVVVNSLLIATQTALPDRVRARGMAIYQSALMGGTALGAACWGKLAGTIGVPGTISVAAAVGPLVALAFAIKGGVRDSTL